MAAFLVKHELSQIDCGNAIGVSNVAIHHWLEGTQRPREAHRLAIEKWTRGKVTAVSWMTSEEREAIAEAKPFQRSRKPKRSRAAA